MTISFVVIEHVFPTSNRALRTSVKSISTIRILLCQHKDLKGLANSVFYCTEAHRERALSTPSQWHLVMGNIFPAVVASNRFGREYSIQITIKMNMASSFGEDMFFVLEFCLFGWFGLFTVARFFWLVGFLGWLIRGFCSWCFVWCFFFYIPGIHNIPCT